MKTVTSVWLYGSIARADADAQSDVDVLVVSNAADWRTGLEARGIVEGRALSPIHFGWAEVAGMAAYGSLFLHHVRLEGRPLGHGDDPLAALLEALVPYQRAGQEIRAFDTVLDDVRRSIGGPHSPAYELAVIATALRHAFILGCYVSAEPDFGRTSPFRRLCCIFGESSELAAEISSLYDFRLYQQGRAHMPFVPTTADVQQWLDTADGLLARIRERVDVFDRALHRAA